MFQIASQARDNSLVHHRVEPRLPFEAGQVEFMQTLFWLLTARIRASRAQ
jgi:hypothetical protein